MTGGRHPSSGFEGSTSSAPVPGHGKVVLWWQTLDAVRESRQALERLHSLLDDDELSRIDKISSQDGRDIYLLAHGLARLLLSQAANVAPRDWRYEKNDHGKPEVLVPKGLPKLRVNLSHTNGLAAVGIGLEEDLGVDVEWLGRNRPNVDRVARRVFSAREKEGIESAGSADNQFEAFLKFWTLKEALVKATGKGLAQPLTHISMDPDRLAVSFDDEPEDVSPDWHFYQERISPEHILASAVRKKTGVEPPRFELFRPSVDYLDAISWK